VCSIDEEARMWIRGFLLRVWSVMFLMWARRGGVCGIWHCGFFPFFALSLVFPFVGGVERDDEVWLMRCG